MSSLVMQAASGIVALVTVVRSSGMFHVRPRWTVLVSGLAVPDCAGPARPPNPSHLLTGPGAAWPPSLPFYRRSLGQPGPNPLLLSTALAPSPHFYRQGPGQPGLPNLSLLLARPAGPTPHFYWPGPSPLLALGGPNPGFGPPLIWARSKAL